MARLNPTKARSNQLASIRISRIANTKHSNKYKKRQQQKQMRSSRLVPILYMTYLPISVVHPSYSCDPMVLENIANLIEWSFFYLIPIISFLENQRRNRIGSLGTAVAAAGSLPHRIQCLDYTNSHVVYCVMLFWFVFLAFACGMKRMHTAHTNSQSINIEALVWTTIFSNTYGMLIFQVHQNVSVWGSCGNGFASSMPQQFTFSWSRTSDRISRKEF